MCNETRKSLLGTEVRYFEKPRVQVFAILSANDEDPVPASTLESMLGILSFEDTCVRLKSFGMFRPIDEDLFVEFFDWEVDAFIK